MRIDFNTRSAESYRLFLKVRRCPIYHFKGTSAIVPDEYAKTLGLKPKRKKSVEYNPIDGLFDYQLAITATAIAKRKYAIFADCGLGKTMMILEYARQAADATRGKILIVSPLMVCNQTVDEAAKWYGEQCGIRRIRAAELQEWLNTPGEAIAVTNYEAIREGLTPGKLTGLILDESSMLKSHYGAWGTRLIELGRGLEWKLCATGTPAPNDRIEFANHAVFLDRAKTVNEFLASYFINRGETQNRWELKPHALKPFYRSLADWSIFLTNPATYGWKDNVGVTPPIHIHIDHIDLTDAQRKAAQKQTGALITNQVGGIGDRGKLSRLAKGGDSLKPEFIRNQVASWPDESTIIWCHYNDEQASMERMFPDAVSISGDTPEEKRQIGIDRFKCGDVKVLISKPKILGFGLNLQVCTRQVFSGLKDSYEEFYQAVKRSNRIGSTRPLNVHIPVTELESPFVDNVLRKAGRVQSDTEQHERLFKEIANANF
jgi:hypothetical protein